MIRRFAIGFAAAGVMATVLAGGASTASAATFKTNAKWKSCDTKESAIQVRATFADVARYGGSGRYMVKKWVEWEYLKTRGEWREADRRYAQTRWVKITNQNFDFISTAGDRTNWANLYESGWRAKVTFKLIKNRPGPRDKKVDEIQIYPAKGSFREIGSYCDPGSISSASP